MGKAELKIQIDQSLLEEAEAMDLDLSAIASEGVRRALAGRRAGEVDTAKASAWAAENARAFELHRERIAEHGVFGEDLRDW